VETHAQRQRTSGFGPDFAAALLRWYDENRRDLPWRAKPGEWADPYRVWLSEIMLQQTTVKAVIPYFEAFLAKWPALDALAAAPLVDVLAAWSGLGYYARARNLHACAQEAARLGGLPDSETELLKLPGIGPYTAAAIAAIAFDRHATAVDGNVERVVARIFAVEHPLPALKPEIKALARTLTPAARPGDFTQAMMDLGATICSPKSPSCLICPVRTLCRAHHLGLAASLPRRAVKADKPLRAGLAFVGVRGVGEAAAILLRRRPAGGLLGGMMEVPGSDWTRKPNGDDTAGRPEARPPFPADWRRVPGLVSHSFTHFHLDLTVYAARTETGGEPAAGSWIALDRLHAQAMPGVMQKAVAHGLTALGLDPPSGYAHKAPQSASSVATVERSARPSTRAGRK
jgi:A/G-specific adenine glycosylase